MTVFFTLIIGMLTGAFMDSCAYQVAAGRPCFRWYRCSACGVTLSWQEVIPIWSWLRQGGRTRCCNTRLDVRYLWTDAILGPVYVFLWVVYPPAQALAYSVMAAGLLLAALVDMDHRIIPDRCSMGGMLAGFAFSVLVPALMGVATPGAAAKASLIGMVAGAGALTLVAVVGGAAIRKDAMGMGDIKFMAAIGAFLGWQAVPWTILSGSLLACLVVFPRLLRTSGMGTTFSFGPFLAVGAMSWLAGGRHIMQNYTAILFPHL